MKRVLIFAVIVLSVGLSSCQCANKPDIGPVEEENEQDSVQTGSAERSVSATSLHRA